MTTTPVPSSSLARRDFLKTVGLATASAAVAAPALSFAQESGQTLTVAFVGCAHIHTPQFVGMLKRRPDVKVKGVWDHDQARAEKRARELGTQTIPDAKSVWDDPAINAVVICSETNRHRDLVLPAAAAKKHMFVEKPLGITAAESYEMAEAIAKNNLLFTTGYFMRTQPQNLFLKEQIAAGAFGKITRVRGSNCHSGSLGGWFDTEWRWMADPKIAGVGGFGDLGTHSLDILMWLLGDVEAITADIKVVTGRYGDCDESGEALIKFKSGVTATLAAGWVDVLDPVTIQISGTEGHAVKFGNDLYFKSKKVEGADGGDPWRKLPKAPKLPLDQFLNAVAGQKDQPLVTPREAAARVAVMEAAYKAAKTGTWAKPA
ncbi:MAG: Gfo/Idh/MocA family oxidoreductase [Verrucomicrobia bacterium]|nr:Gfo/Idh/MocA family oxidoreductase [Verrucomicrobiota bacterium]